MQVPLPVRQRGDCCEVNLDLAPAAIAAAVDIFKVLADPSRLQMVAALREAIAPICVCDFTAALGLSQPTISHHMGKLRQAGLVRVTKEGVWSFYELDPALSTTVRALLDAAIGVAPASRA
jgi:ArsR family transcriptional regulator